MALPQSSLSDSEASDEESWTSGGWRSRATARLALLSVFIFAASLAVPLWQGMSRGLFYLFLCVPALIALAMPVASGPWRARVLISSWVLVALGVGLDFGLVMPAAPLAMTVYAVLLAVFFGSRGIVAAIVITFAIVGIAWFAQWQWSAPFAVQSDAPMLDPTRPSNLLRISVVALCTVAMIASAVSYVVRQQEQALQLLREETRERLSAERAFQEAQKAELVAQITSGLAHNFGNALTVITTWAELIRRNPDDQEYLRKGMDDVSAAAVQAASIARQIMVLGKNYFRSPEPIRLDEEVEQQVSLARTLLPTSVQIHCELEKTPLVEIDRSEIQQGILNLILNARDAVGDVGEIRVRLWSHGDCVCLSVSDNGCGMSESILQRIFDPFFTTKGLDGTGLGLASLKHSLEAANGTIAVETKVNEGATFTLSFPALRARPGDGDETADGASLAPGTARILLVDDEDMVRDVIAMALRNFGHEVVDAIDIQDGIRAVEEENGIDMMITDAVMPGGDLNELITAFKTRYPGRPLMVCSGYMRDDVAQKIESDEKVDFMQKPVDFDELRTRIDELLLRAKA